MTKNKIIFSEVPEEYSRNLISENGMQGKIYRVDEKTIFKQYRDTIYSLVHLELLTDLKSDYFAFPEILVFENSYSERNFKGYLSKFIDGITLNELPVYTDMNVFLDALEKFEKEIIKLSRRGLLMHDMHHENLIYTQDLNLSAVDTDLYELTSDDDIFILKNNIKELGETVLSFMTDFSLIESSKLNRLMEQCTLFGKVRPSWLLREYIEYFQQRMMEIRTVGDFKDSIMTLKLK